MEPRECVERILAGLADGDASEVIQAAGELIDFILGQEHGLASTGERERIQRGMVELGLACDSVRIGYPGPSCCADCGSDRCCRMLKGDVG